MGYGIACTCRANSPQAVSAASRSPAKSISGRTSFRVEGKGGSSCILKVMERRVALVDVFGEVPLKGNPLAVVVDADGLSDDEMLEITRWFNLSETTFLVPAESSDADYSVRIFTLSGELPFAGHPTLGTCHVWSTVGGKTKSDLVQECGAGLVRLRQTAGGFAFEAPPLIRDGPVESDEVDRLADVLGIQPSDIVACRWVDNGPGWVGLLLNDAEVVLALEPDFNRHPERKSLKIGVAGFYSEASACAYEIRAFFSNAGGQVTEDPVTGSLNASVAEWLLSEGRVTAPYTVSQGTRLGRLGRVHISQDDDGSVWVGGNTSTVVNGLFTL